MVQVARCIPDRVEAQSKRGTGSNPAEREQDLGAKKEETRARLVIKPQGGLNSGREGMMEDR